MPRPTVRIAVAALVAGVALVGVVPGAEGAAPVLRAGANARIGGKAPLLRTAEASGLVVDPGDARHIVEAEVNPRYGLCQWNVTFDGGATWTTGVLKAPAKFGDTPCIGFNTVNRLRYDGGIAFGSGQNVYIAFDARPPDNSEGSTTLLARSTDGGRTFGPAQVLMPGSPGIEPGFGNQEGQQQSYLRPKIGVLRRGGADRVVVASNGVGFNSRTASVIVSNDSGATWGPIRYASPPGGTAQYVSNPVVDSDGTIYVAWRTQNSTALGFPDGADEFNYIARSTDSGLTWTAKVQRKLAAPTKDARVNEHRLALNPSSGALFYVDNETRVTNNADIFVTRSTDKGDTWTTPVRVNDDPAGPAVAQSVPNISVAPNGRVDVVWSDRRNAYFSQNNYHDVYMASSSDGATTFGPNRRLTDRSLSLTNGLTTVRSTDFFVPGLVALGNDEVMVAWPDPRLTDFETENSDIFFARVRVDAATPPPSSALPLSQPAGLSAALSRLAYPGGGEKFVAGGPVGTTVVVVNDHDPALAAAASVLARAELAPVLATPSYGLPPDVAAEVKRLTPAGAFVVGDEAAVSATVVADLVRAGIPAGKIFRLAGGDAAGTASIVADTYVKLEKAAERAVPTTAVVVDPGSKEVGVAAAMAAALRFPLLFATRDAVPTATAGALTTLGLTSTVVVGGTGLVGNATLAALPKAIRLAGADLYGTAREVAGYAASQGVPANVDYLADGDRPIDAALLAAPVARLGGLVVITPGGDPAGVANGPDRVVVARSVDAGPLGYRLVGGDGGVFAFGGARFLGSPAALKLVRPIVATASAPGGLGYWLAASDGGVFAYGSAGFFGSTGAVALNKPIVSMAATPSGQGYWLVASDGGVFAFGDAAFHGSMGARKLNQPIVGIAASPTGAGYWLVASDGGLFAFGDAGYVGSTGATRLNRPIVGMAATPSGRGYLLAASDGGIFAFGDARFAGSTGAMTLNKAIVAMAATPSADGYWLVASDGGVFAFGAAPFLGSAGAVALNRPIVAAG